MDDRRRALDHIYEKIKDHEVFKNKRGPKQMDPKYQLMLLLNYRGVPETQFSPSVLNIIIGPMKMRERRYRTGSERSSTYPTVLALWMEHFSQFEILRTCCKISTNFPEIWAIFINACVMWSTTCQHGRSTR